MAPEIQIAQWFFMAVLGVAGYLLRTQYADAMQRIKTLETTVGMQGNKLVELYTAAKATSATLARLEATAADILQKIDEIKDRLPSKFASA